MPLLPFAQFGPDRSSFDAQFCDRIENCLPKPNAWMPFPSFVPLSQPLPADPLGSFLAYVANGAYRLYVGTQTKLYMLDISTLGWLDKTRTTGGNYNGAAGVRWSMCQYGNYMLATNGQDQPQWIDNITATSFADIAAPCPKAYNVNAVGDFVFFSNLTSNQRMVQWSGLNQPFFYTPRQRSSDFQAFPDGGEIMGTASGEKGIVIFQAESIREGHLALDTPLVFNFNSSVPNHGCLAPRSIIPTGAGIFYYSDDGFYKYGTPPIPIGIGRVDRWFFDNIQNADVYDIYGGEDPTRKVVYWAFRSTANQTAGTYDIVLLYHYGYDQWSTLKPGQLLTGLIDATSPGYTLDGLNTLGFDLDHLPYSLDSRTWSGSTPVIAAFDQQRRLGFFAGEPMQAVLQTGDNQINEQGRASVNGFRPLIDAANVFGRTGTKETPGDDIRWRDPVSINRVGIVPQITSGQFHRFEITVPTQPWNDAHGLYPDLAQPDGEQ